ncbi:MAG: winged helix-turn-helix transcriptional regulator [Gammaproteobacteria bacterium]|nr:winged helix-turn-helix transcriptional regulator [Gammaproteobacteria bacterium]
MTQHAPPSLLLKHFLPYRMVNLAKRISDACAQVYVDAFGLTVPEWRILARLAEDKRLNLSAIGAITFMDKSMVTRAVKLLDAKGFLLREKDPADNRITYLSLSAAGQQFYHEIAPNALEWEGELIGALQVDEYRDLFRIMDKLDQQLDHMQAQRKGGQKTG